MRQVLAAAGVLFGAALLLTAVGRPGDTVVRGQDPPSTPAPPRPLYDPDTEHIWNRVDRQQSS